MLWNHIDRGIINEARFLEVLSVFILIIFSPTTAGADGVPGTGYLSIEYLENGDYIITEYAVDLSGGISPNSTMATKHGAKTASYFNSAGTKIWSVTVNGTFSLSLIHI